MKINHAILHVFDFVSCVNVYAQEELDLSSKNAKRYVTSHAKKALGNIDSKRGEFAENSMFAEELRCYFRGQREFVDLSVQVAEFIAGELGRMEKTESADLLVVDFEDDPDNTVREMTDDEAEAAYRGEGKRYFAFMLLEAKQAYMHEVGYGESGAQRVDIARHHAILPNPSQKVASFAVIESKTLSVSFCDKERAIAGENRWLIPDGLLQCSNEASSKELFDTTMGLVEEVAEEFGVNSAVAMGRAKAYLAENADDSDEVPFDEFVDEVFDDEGPRRRFEQAAADEQLGESVHMERDVAKRVSRNHKIVTDTGIVLTFPAEYSHNTELIEFKSAPNGLIQIELKNIGSIENR